MLKLFSVGLTANLLYVASGALKQYFIAAQLPVAGVGIYGAWVAQAALLLVLIPFPAYLDVLIRGFSAAPEDHTTRSGLLAAVTRELKWLSVGSTAVLVCVALVDLAVGHAKPTAEALLLLLVAQYLTMTSDILLRIRQAHGRFALFMATRNLPSLIAIIVFGLNTPMAIVGAELFAALLIGWFVYRSKIVRSAQPVLCAPRSFNKEQVTLWVARLGQYANSALLRLIVPFLYGANDTGLFFFACIAQIPCALFLSVTTQLFGHAIARMRRGQLPMILRIQMWFLIPNVLYVAAVALLMPYWPALTTHVPKLIQYSGIGRLLLAVSLYSAVLSSDCTEYLLRSRGMSHFLLRYNLCSIAIQILCLCVGAIEGMSIENTIMVCAAAAGVVLTVFSGYSFCRVLLQSSAARSVG